MGTVLASINANKGLRTPKRRCLIERWLSGNRVDVLLVQEPWAHSHGTAIDLEGFVPVSGNSNVFAWISEQLEAPPHEQVTGYAQRLTLGYVRMFNLYLSAHSREERATQLRALLPVLQEARDQPTLVVGDFNLAPRDVDGVAGERPSTFNNRVDRVPF